MKSLYLIAALFIMTIASAQDTTETIYLIRHAEKADGTSDTHLSEAGMQRAQQWAAYLSDKRIVAVLSTPYNRTRETAQPLADLLGLPVTEYDPREMELAAILKKYRNCAIVIVGHSNTIPGYINRLLGKTVYADIPENEFGQVFIVSAENQTHIDVKVEKLP